MSPSRVGRRIDSMSAPTPSAGHRFLDTYDLLWRIFSFSGHRTRGAQGLYTLSRGDLARCVRVCRSFHDPAVRVLWSSLDGFIPLWQLLAPPALPFQPQYSEEHFRRIVDARLWENSGCWDRFLKHSHYVLTLRVSIFHMVGGHAGLAAASIWNKRLLHHLLEHNGGAPILSSLRSLTWSWASIEDAYMPSMLCPSLSELCMVYHASHSAEETSLLTALRRLQEASPRLTTLILQVLDDAGHWLVDELVQLRNLRKITLSSTLLLGEVHALLTMPNLSSLNAKVSVEDASEASVTAQCLQNLELHGSSPDLTRTFATLILPSLESLELYVFDTTPCGPGLFISTTTLAAALESNTLRRLHLTFNATYDSSQLPPLDPTVSLSALLQPVLRNTPMLEVFILRFDGPLKLWANDDAFEDMAQAWPSLQMLRLDFRAWHESGPMPTPAILTHFARSCPRLQELVLPYLDHHVEVDPALYVKLHGHALRRLFIADDRSLGRAGPPDHTLALAEMVSDLFPHLDLSFRAYIKNPDMPWWKVFDCLRASPKRPSANGLLHAASHSYLP
ncbi:hypothetical protein C8T65DRAFT_637460 [Cerioporus squamosus]|nr:hypothetical protein C8T65DRAFT_637460 [Cerioporus squamosus]